MIYVFAGEYGASVVYDDNTITTSTKARGIALESLPATETPEGKIARLWADAETVWWEYEDIPIPSEDPY